MTNIRYDLPNVLPHSLTNDLITMIVTSYEVLGVVPFLYPLRWSWSFHLFLGRPMLLFPFGLYLSASLGILSVSILSTCCSHSRWYCFISKTMFCTPNFKDPIIYRNYNSLTHYSIRTRRLHGHAHTHTHTPIRLAAFIHCYTHYHSYTMQEPALALQIFCSYNYLS